MLSWLIWTGASASTSIDWDGWAITGDVGWVVVVFYLNGMSYLLF